MTNPANVTKSIGLLADAPLSWFLHHANPDTDGNSPYHRAVIRN